MADVHHSLYRKYRPQTFGELIGQEHVTTALRNAVREGRVGHAYLFSGPRGTGKTTSARILAKALNCLDLQPDGEPCGKCENCVAIAEGRFLDLFELDAASNNSVDNIRDLTDRVHLGMGPTAQRKVYLVDEVHMLSAAASNALLKTLEEPPDHVVFVLATTNPEKVLQTIRSRTQHFEFKLLTADEIAARLRNLVDAEGVEADDEALAVIARAGAGSARDAESLLDQALAHASGALDAGVVADIFGSTPFDSRAAMLDAIGAEDAPGVLVALGHLLDSGHEPRRIAEDLLRTARDAFLVGASGGKARIESSPEQEVQLQALGSSLGNATLVRVLETVGKAIVDMRGTDAADPRLVLEIALVRLTKRDADTSVAALNERVEKLERTIAELRNGGGASAPAPAASPTRRAPAPAATPAASKPAPADPASGPAPPGATLGALRKQRQQAQQTQQTKIDAASDASAAGAAPTASPIGGAGAGARDGDPGKGSPAAASDDQKASVTLDDVILTWSEILPSLPVATRSAVGQAQPIELKDDVITFAVPKVLIEAARPRFKREADTIRTALSERLGRRLKFKVVAGEFDSAPIPSDDEPPPPPEPDDDVDPGELVDAAPDDVAVASFGLLTESLGASVVEERPRE